MKNDNLVVLPIYYLRKFIFIQHRKNNYTCIKFLIKKKIFKLLRTLKMSNKYYFLQYFHIKNI